MIITGATREQLDHALAVVNEEFADNITYRNITELPARRDKRPSWRITLTVLDSSKPGGRRGATNNRRIAAACWHVHGRFLDQLPMGTTIKSMACERPYTIAEYGHPWFDWPVTGDNYGPIMASQTCECE